MTRCSVEMLEDETAVVFPGQGVQRNGMGHDFYQGFALARHAFEEASEAAKLDLAALCFNDDARLGLTEFAQPAIVATEIAMFRVLEQEFGLRASAFGGHSLGEYAALVAAGALPLGRTVSVVRERGRLMQEAVEVGRGRMVAVVARALDLATIAQTIDDLQVDIANDNSEEQVVLSGITKDTHTAEQRLARVIDKVRTVELEVSAPFHSSLMKVIEPDFATVLNEQIRDHLDASRAARVTSNVSGEFHRPDADSVLELLLRQVSNTVHWRSNMTALAKRSSRIFEVGPGRPLRRFFKTQGVSVKAINSLRAADSVRSAGTPASEHPTKGGQR